MRVKEIMQADVACCSEGDSLNSAAQLMWERDIGSVPVVDASHKPIGMLTDRDICMAAYTQGRSLGDIQVGSAMSRGVHACGPEETLESVEKTMRTRQVRRMPVVNNGKLVGLIALNDLAVGASKGSVGLDEVGSTLAGICMHRTRPAQPAVEAA